MMNKIKATFTSKVWDFTDTSLFNLGGSDQDCEAIRNELADFPDGDIWLQWYRYTNDRSTKEIVEETWAVSWGRRGEQVLGNTLLEAIQKLKRA